ncbi:MAG: cardiolipin synthase [Mycoplasmataceae bacterium]|nr:cardiolipin synthase [Mycoplasmataceae bacterium]
MKKNISWIIEMIMLLSILLIVFSLLIVSKVDLDYFMLVVGVVYFLNIIISIWIFLTERNFESKISWLIFIIIFPIVGHICFIFFGRKEKTEFSRIEYEKQFKLYSNLSFHVENSNETNYFKNKMSSLTKRNWKNSNVKIYKHCFEAYESLFQDIKNAKEYIHIELYIIKLSEIYEELKLLLIQKINEGVEVRMIIDDFGKWSFSDDEISSMKREGIKIEIFNKINFPFINMKQSFRLHRKIFIIDGIIGYTGGMNISDEYSSFDKKYGYWVDINVKITGDTCNDFSQLFLFDWAQFKNEKLDTNKYITKQKNEATNSQSLFLEEGPNVSEYILEKSLINCISFSNKRIRIATPYFIPSKKIIEQFKFALLEGVDIEIFVPGLADKRYILEATRIYLNDLILSGAKVYELKNMFIHSKMGTFDDTYGYIGTINWDMRTFYSNYESLNFLSGDVIKEMNDIFDDYKKKSTLLLPILKKPGSIKNLFKKLLIKILSPLM